MQELINILGYNYILVNKQVTIDSLWSYNVTTLHGLFKELYHDYSTASMLAKSNASILKLIK